MSRRVPVAANETNTRECEVAKGDRAELPVGDTIHAGRPPDAGGGVPCCSTWGMIWVYKLHVTQQVLVMGHVLSNASDVVACAGGRM